MTQHAAAVKIEAQNVIAGYGDRTVLHDVTLRCTAGAFVGLIGPNGCGKSTLLRVLSGILRPQQGRVLLDERPLADYTPRDIARRMAFVPQEEKAAFEFTARDVVLMGRFPYRVGRRGPSEADYAHVEQALAAVDIIALADRPITELSGGEHRRVLLARALAQQTPLLLLDEPTAHLDITHQAELLLLAQALAHPQALQGQSADADKSNAAASNPRHADTDAANHPPKSSRIMGDSTADSNAKMTPPVGVLAALHDLNQAAEYCDRLVLMAEGLIVAQGTPDEVLVSAHIRTAYQAQADIGRNPVTGRPMLYALRPLRSPNAPRASNDFLELETPPPKPAS